MSTKNSSDLNVYLVKKCIKPSTNILIYHSFKKISGIDCLKVIKFHLKLQTATKIAITNNFRTANFNIHLIYDQEVELFK